MVTTNTQSCRTWIFERLTVGAMSFFAFSVFVQFDYRYLDPQFTDWLQSGDLAQSHIGWVWYYYQDHVFPFHLEGYIYPLGASLSTTDSIPFFSLLMKLILPQQENAPQIFGFWFLTCFVLQGIVAFAIAAKLTFDRKARFFCVALTLFAPAFFYRYFHVALCGQWIVLLCIYLGLFTMRHNFFKTMLWSSLAILALGIHPYFVLFVVVFAFLDFFRFLWTDKKSFKPMHVAPSILIVLSSVVLTAYFLELFENQPPIANHFQFFGADFFMFFNGGKDLIISPPLWNFTMGQYEAYAYLGIPVIILLLILIRQNWGLIVTQVKSVFLDHQSGPIFLAALLLWFFSLGESFRIFGFWVLKLDYLFEPVRPFLSSFRTNGRFIWAAMYCFIIWIPIYFFKKNNDSKAYLFALLLFSVHIIDIWYLGLAQHSIPPNRYTHIQLPKGTARVDIFPVSIPAAECNGNVGSDFYLNVAIDAAKNQIPLNSGARAHPDPSKIDKHCQKLKYHLQHLKIDPGVFYIVQKSYSYVLPPEKKKNCQEDDQAIYCWAGPAISENPQ